MGMQEGGSEPSQWACEADRRQEPGQPAKGPADLRGMQSAAVSVDELSFLSVKVFIFFTEVI